jgi:hypothetical protein
MGADIYLSSKFDKNFDEVQKEIDEVKRLFESTSKQTLLLVNAMVFLTASTSEMT